MGIHKNQLYLVFAITSAQTNRSTANSVASPPAPWTKPPASNFFFHLPDSYRARISVNLAATDSSTDSATIVDGVHVHRPNAQLRI